MATKLSIVIAESLHRHYRITPEQNGGLCLDVPGGNAYNGAGLWLWECDQAYKSQLYHNQKWAFSPVTMGASLEELASAIEWNGYMDTEHGGNIPNYEAFCVDGGDMGAGTQLYLWECNGQPQQQWSIDVALNAMERGTAASMYVDNGAACLDYYEDQANNGQAFHVWDCNGLANQRWHLSEFIPVDTNDCRKREGCQPSCNEGSCGRGGCCPPRYECTSYDCVWDGQKFVPVSASLANGTDMHI